MRAPKIDGQDYEHILWVLDKRSNKVRRNVFILIYFLIIVVAAVVVIAYNIKNTSDSPLANAINAFMESRHEKELKSALSKYALGLESKAVNKSLENKKNEQDATAKNVDSMNDDSISQTIKANWLSSMFPAKSTSEKIAESIAGLVISFSVLMFIGFVMRALLVFIKYYLQLGTDFENQKIAFMLSKGEHEAFSESLCILREHNITFEKTPSMSHEKILDKAIELAKSVKGDSAKS
ncbi:hypothetical protein [Pantoea agglomerans]